MFFSRLCKGYPGYFENSLHRCLPDDGSGHGDAQWRQFGDFMFGGSNIVTVIQYRNIALDAEVGRQYLQGQRPCELI